MTIKKPLVIGMGVIGGLVSYLLKQNGMKVAGMDRDKTSNVPEGIEFIKGDVRDSRSLLRSFIGHDAVICCLPYFLTLTIAKAAHKSGIHYFDATEDVATTNAIRKLATSSKAAMVPQNGLAPGFIGIVGSNLAKKFDPGTLRYIKLRVGALPQHPIGQLGYAGNWSLDGLVHEYIAECDVIEQGKRQKIPALSRAEIIRIDGVEYEAFSTSGGLGTMTETYENKVETLDYKSIRYPGHLSGMKLLIEDLRFKENEDLLVKLLANALPPDDNDRVLIHASAQGKIKGKLQIKEWVKDYKPMEIGGRIRTSIAWTTAASIVAVVELVSSGKLPQKGFVKQEDISLASFLKTKTGKFFLDDHPTLHPSVH